MICDKCKLEIINGKCLCNDDEIGVSIGESWTEEALRDYCKKHKIDKTDDHFKKIRELLE